MKIAYDAQGKVWLSGDSIPSQWNGIELTVLDLNDEQTVAFKSAQKQNGSAIFFNGSTFTVTPKAAPDYRQLRLEAYRARGATETACIEAIIEHMAGKPEKMVQLAAIRDSVKRDFPKP